MTRYNAMDFRSNLQQELLVQVHNNKDHTDLYLTGYLTSFYDTINGKPISGIAPNNLTVIVDDGNVHLQTTVQFIKFDKGKLM